MPQCSAVCIVCLHRIDFQYMCQRRGGLVKQIPTVERVNPELAVMLQIITQECSVFCGDMECHMWLHAVCDSRDLGKDYLCLNLQSPPQIAVKHVFLRCYFLLQWCLVVRMNNFLLNAFSSLTFSLHYTLYTVLLLVFLINAIKLLQVLAWELQLSCNMPTRTEAKLDVCNRIC